jgi:hypothetical protein
LRPVPIVVTGGPAEGTAGVAGGAEGAGFPLKIDLNNVLISATTIKLSLLLASLNLFIKQAPLNCYN